MSLVDESLKRMLSGATLAGFLPPAGGGTAIEAAVRVDRLEKSAGSREWRIQLVVTPGGNGSECCVNADVQWAGSTPVLTIHETEIPNIGTVSGKLMIHNYLFAGTWVYDGQKGQAWGKIAPRPSNERQPRRFVIERSSEYLREWWTGDDWSKESGRAWWFEHEPDGPRLTGDEESHAVCYPRGKVEAG